MAILHVRNVPEDLYACLTRRAEAERRSLRAEVISLLEQALRDREEADRIAATLSEIRSRRSFCPATAGAPESAALLRRDRER